jgi:HK97 family phage major capsid protein
MTDIPMPAPEGAAAGEAVPAIRRWPMERQFRAAAFERGAINTDARTVELAFSSETPVERVWGLEILDHSEESIDLEFLRSGRAPLLVDHDPADQVGVVEDVSIGPDRVARARVRFGRSARAEEVFQDVIDGIRLNVSVGYVIERMEADPPALHGGREAYRATAWRPLELSSVSIPADVSVGVGRSAAPAAAAVTPSEICKPTEVFIMSDSINEGAVRDAAAKGERERASSILDLAARHNVRDLGEKAVREGASVEQFRGALLDVVAERGKPLSVDSDIGLSDREVRNFSFIRAIAALQNPGDKALQQAAAFEREVSRAAATKSGKAERGMVIPTDVLTRDLITGTATSTSKGGNLIQTDVLGGSFIDSLRNKMVLQAVGARFMSGLQGNVAIPKRTTAVTAYWPGENTAPTEGNNVFGQVTMSPKTLAAYIDVGRRLALQASVDVEALVRDDLATTLAIAIDSAALGGAVTNAPTGVRGTSGIGSVAIGTNGGAPTWASIVNLVREVEVDNALNGAAAFVTNPRVKAKLATTPRQSSGIEGNFLLPPPYDSLYGYPLVVSNQIPSNLTKGSATSVCSAMMFGVWSDLMIGQWGGIELINDNMSLSTTGATRIVALAELDVAVRYPESFAAVLDYTTT